MVLVAVELLTFASHSARHLRPAIFLPIRKSLLHEFERLDIVGRGEPARAVEGQEGIQPPRARIFAFLNRAQRPGRYMHLRPAPSGKNVRTVTDEPSLMTRLGKMIRLRLVSATRWARSGPRR